MQVWSNGRQSSLPTNIAFMIIFNKLYLRRTKKESSADTEMHTVSQNLYKHYFSAKSKFLDEGKSKERFSCKKEYINYLLLLLKEKEAKNAGNNEALWECYCKNSQ